MDAVTTRVIGLPAGTSPRPHLLSTRWADAGGGLPRELADLLGGLGPDVTGAAVADGPTLVRLVRALATTLRTTVPGALEVVRQLPDRPPRLWIPGPVVPRGPVPGGLAVLRPPQPPKPRPERPARTATPPAHETGVGADRDGDDGRERLEGSREAVRVLREAVRREPGRHLGDLAAALRDHSRLLAGGGQAGEAVTAAEDAVALRQHLAKRDAGQLPELAEALADLAARLGDAGRRTESLVVLEDAVTLRRHLANDGPARHLPPLAATLDDLAAGLEAAGLHDARVVAREDAVALRRHLARSAPGRFLPDLAASLQALARSLAAVGRPAEALAAVEEAVVIRRDLVAHRPSSAPDRAALAASLEALSVGLGALGQRPESLAAGEEAAQLLRPLAEHDPARHLDALATALENLAIGLGAMGRHAEGRAASDQAATLRRAGAAALATTDAPGPCWCSCHHVEAPPVLDTSATTGPVPVVVGA